MNHHIAWIAIQTEHRNRIARNERQGACRPAAARRPTRSRLAALARRRTRRLT